MLSIELREQIARQLELGATLADVQAELIEPAKALSEDESAALWLFAWSYSAEGHRPTAEMLGAGAR